MTNARDKANIPVLNFASKGIDDNATETTITIDSDERVKIVSGSPTQSAPSLTLKDDGATTTGAKPRLGFQDSANTYLGELGYASGGTSDLYLNNIQNANLIFSTNNAEGMRLTSTGLGIGLTNPDSFHSSGNDLVVGSTTGGHGLTIVASTNDAGSINFADGSSSNASYRGKITYEHSNDSLAFHTGATERFKVASNGNFSIKTSADSRTLNVFDSTPIVALYNSTTGTGNSDGFQLQLSSDDGYLWNYESGGHTIFGTAGAERMRISSDGKVGIGTSAPESLFHLSSASPVITFQETDQSNRKFQIGSFGNAYAIYDATNTQYRYILDNSGNHIFNEGGADCDFRVESDNATHALFVQGSNGHIGINTSSPTYALNIANGAGNMRIKTTDSANVANASTSLLEFHGSNNRAGYAGFVGGDMVIHTDTYSAGDIKLQTNGAERMRLLSNGRICINRTSSVGAAKLNFIC